MNESQYQFPHDSMCHTVYVFHILTYNFYLNLMRVSYYLLEFFDMYPPPHFCKC